MPFLSPSPFGMLLDINLAAEVRRKERQARLVSYKINGWNNSCILYLHLGQRLTSFYNESWQFLLPHLEMPAWMLSSPTTTMLSGVETLNLKTILKSSCIYLLLYYGPCFALALPSIFNCLHSLSAVLCWENEKQAK